MDLKLIVDNRNRRDAKHELIRKRPKRSLLQNILIKNKYLKFLVDHRSCHRSRIFTFSTQIPSNILTLSSASTFNIDLFMPSLVEFLKISAVILVILILVWLLICTTWEAIQYYSLTKNNCVTIINENQYRPWQNIMETSTDDQHNQSHSTTIYVTCPLSIDPPRYIDLYPNV